MAEHAPPLARRRKPLDRGWQLQLFLAVSNAFPKIAGKIKKGPMEIKILCACGAKYKFDVEPLNGQLPGPVRCPVCGADGTEAGNRIVAQELGAASRAVPVSVAAVPSMPATPAPAPQASRSGFVAPVIPRSSKTPAAAPAAAVPALTVPAATSAAAPSSPAAALAVPLTAPEPSLVPKPSVRVALSVAGHATAPAAEPEPAPASPAPPVSSRPAPRSAPKAEPSFTRGLIGIAVASIVALIFWFAFTYFVGARFKFVIIALGAFIGWTGHWLAQQKSQPLGIAAAIASGVVFLLGMLWSARQEAFESTNLILAEAWEARLEYAQGAVQARTEDELRKFLSENGYSPEEAATSEEEEGDFDFRVTPPEEIDAKTLADFRRTELPELRKIAEGKISRSTFERQHRAELEAVMNAGYVGQRVFRFRNLTLMLLAVGAAWKLCSPS